MEEKSSIDFFHDLKNHFTLKSGAGVSTSSLLGVRHGYHNRMASTTDSRGGGAGEEGG